MLSPKLTLPDECVHAVLRVVIEEYPDFAKGPCALFLQEDAQGSPAHVVWGILKGYDEPVVLVTAYLPDPQKWDRTYRKRLQP